MATGTNGQIEKALATQTGASALAAPDPKEVEALVNRFSSILTYKGAEKLTQQEKIALAFNSLLYGLNPALGEIWYIHKIGIMIGRDGWVKKLTEKGQREDFRWWPQYVKLRPDEMREYEIDPEKVVIAYRCEIRRDDTIAAYTNALKAVGEAIKLTYEQMIELLGKPPVVIGIGVIYTSEELYGNMTKDERCKKRAFAACCRQIVDLPFAVASEGEKVNGSTADYAPTGAPSALLDDVVEGETVEAPEKPPEPPREPASEPVVETVPSAPGAAQDAPESAVKRNVGRAADEVIGLVRTKMEDNAATMKGDASDKQVSAVNIPLEKAFDSSATKRKDRLAALSLLVDRDIASAKDLSKSEASAIIGWTKSAPPLMIAAECHRLLTVAMKRRGQTEMELVDETATEEPTT